mmetsp:Transcript_8374/g.23782  ORF Transcript_8374/g.23782 Transcript_8374/m.23782 type:complete len:256 (-) Transcript_8374:158-925(-)
MCREKLADVSSCVLHHLVRGGVHVHCNALNGPAVLRGGVVVDGHHSPNVLVLESGERAIPAQELRAVKVDAAHLEALLCWAKLDNIAHVVRVHGEQKHKRLECNAHRVAEDERPSKQRATETNPQLHDVYLVERECHHGKNEDKGGHYEGVEAGQHGLRVLEGDGHVPAALEDGLHHGVHALERGIAGVGGVEQIGPQRLGVDVAPRVDVFADLDEVVLPDDAAVLFGPDARARAGAGTGAAAGARERRTVDGLQ